MLFSFPFNLCSLRNWKYKIENNYITVTIGGGGKSVKRCNINKWNGWAGGGSHATPRAKWQNDKKKHENSNNFHKKPLDINRYSCQKEQRWFKSSLLVRSLIKTLFCFHLQKTELFIVCWMGPVSHCTLCEKLQKRNHQLHKDVNFFLSIPQMMHAHAKTL